MRYLALGDSFTIGTGSEPTQSFPARLAARWQQSGSTVELRNLGVNGYTTQNLVDRELPVAHDFAPTFVTLAIGANDIVRGSSVDTYRSQLRRIFDGLAAAGVPGSRVVTVPQPDWALSPVAAEFGDPAAIACRHDRERPAPSQRRCLRRVGRCARKCALIRPTRRVLPR